MYDRGPFLRWFVIACVTIAGFFILWQVGLIATIWVADASCLSGVILAFFLIVSGYLGVATWMIPEDQHFSKTAYEVGWFCSELCLGLGMLGTIIGLVMMLSGFASLNPSDSHSIQQLLVNLGGSMGTALYTTMAGLACGINLKVQSFNMELALRRSA